MTEFQTIENIELSHVNLTPVTPNDFELIFEWLADPKTSRWLDMGGGRQTLSRLQFQAFMANPKMRMFLYGEMNSPPVGFLAINDIGNLMNVAEIWGIRGRKGGAHDLAMAAFVRILATAFVDFNCEVVWTGVLENNHRSIRVHKLLEMPQVGILRARHLFNGRRVNKIIFEFLRKEFENQFGLVKAISGLILSEKNYTKN